MKKLICEKQDLVKKLDHSDLQREHFRLDNEALRKEVKDLEKEKGEIQLELSAARIQINYEKETGIVRQPAPPKRNASKNPPPEIQTNQVK